MGSFPELYCHTGQAGLTLNPLTVILSAEVWVSCGCASLDQQRQQQQQLLLVLRVLLVWVCESQSLRFAAAAAVEVAVVHWLCPSAHACFGVWHSWSKGACRQRYMHHSLSATTPAFMLHCHACCALPCRSIKLQSPLPPPVKLRFSHDVTQVHLLQYPNQKHSHPGCNSKSIDIMQLITAPVTNKNQLAASPPALHYPTPCHALFNPT